VPIFRHETLQPLFVFRHVRSFFYLNYNSYSIFITVKMQGSNSVYRSNPTPSKFRVAIVFVSAYAQRILSFEDANFLRNAVDISSSTFSVEVWAKC